MTRGSTAERGYGGPHARLRQAWRPRVDAGQVNCARCGGWIRPGMAWDLGHTADRTGWTGPEHRRCNRADGARRVNAARGWRRKMLHDARHW